MSAMSELDIDARERAVQAVKQAYPVLVNDFTDRWFYALVDMVVDTYHAHAVQPLLRERQRSRLVYLLNELQDTRQAYDDAMVPEHPNASVALARGDKLSNVAYELHHFLTQHVMTL